MDNVSTKNAARFIVFSNTEKCSADRIINLTLSQGSLQDVLKNAPYLISKDVESYESLVKQIFNHQTFEIDFSYRMRIAVK